MAITAGHGVSQPQRHHPHEEPTILGYEYKLSGDSPPSGIPWRHRGEMDEGHASAVCHLADQSVDVWMPGCGVYAELLADTKL